MLRRLAFASFCLVALAACEVGPEVLVQVSADSDVGEVDQLSISVHTDVDAVPVGDLNTGALAGALPQTFLVRAGSRTMGQMVRVHVEGIRDGVTVAAGDVVLTLPTSGRESGTVVLRRACASVICPRLQSCNVATGACDATCGTDSACAEILGCDAASMCVAGMGGLGTCSGMGANLDGDTFRDGRCSLEPLRTDPRMVDCDDTSMAARPGGVRTCGAARDHDCNGVVDELELCPSACADPMLMGISLVSGDFHIDACSDEVRSVVGMRPTGTNEQLVIVGCANQISAFAFDPAARSARPLGQIPVTGVRQLFLAGPLLAAATDQGLQLVDVDAAGGLRSLGTPVAIPPGAPEPLTAVHVAEGTAWVSGSSTGLAAINVADPENPRLLGIVAGPGSESIARVEGIVLATTSDPARTLVFYPAPPRSAPGPLTNLTEIAGLTDVEATVVAARPGRAGEQTMVAVGAVGTLDAQVRMIERVGGSRFELRDQITGLADIAGVHLDEGVLLYATTSGATSAVVRGAGPGTLMPDPLRVTAPRGLEEGLSGFWATTDDEEQPVVLVGLASRVRVIQFGCTAAP